MIEALWFPASQQRWDFMLNPGSHQQPRNVKTKSPAFTGLL
jgi:predicted phosphodiesterase